MEDDHYLEKQREGILGRANFPTTTNGDFDIFTVLHKLIRGEATRIRMNFYTTQPSAPSSYIL